MFSAIWVSVHLHICHGDCYNFKPYKLTRLQKIHSNSLELLGKLYMDGCYSGAIMVVLWLLFMCGCGCVVAIHAWVVAIEALPVKQKRVVEVREDQQTLTGSVLFLYRKLQDQQVCVQGA